MPLTPCELVRAHARVISLAVLRRSIDTAEPESNELKALPAHIVDKVCLDRSFRIIAANAIISGTAPDPGFVLRRCNASASIPLDEYPVFLTGDEHLDRIIGPKLAGSIVQDESLVKEAWSKAQDVLDDLSLRVLLDAINSVDLVAGLNGPHGEIRALSNPNFPGFIAIGVRNPPLILAEQAVHEAMHVILAARIALDAELDMLTDERVGVLSPFTNSARTIERVVHGVLSYAAVQVLWRAVAHSDEPGRWMDLSRREGSYGIARRRVQALEARLQLAMACLLDGAGEEVCHRTSELSREILGVDLSHFTTSKTSRDQVVSNAGYSTDTSCLTPIERAELLLSMHGTKVSRLTMRVGDISQVGFAVASRVPVATSSWTVRSISDQRIGGFSNIAGERKHVLQSDAESEIHLYLHSNPSWARYAALLDGKDAAGDLFGIPSCCRDWYLREWADASEAGGDLFAVMVRGACSNGEVVVASECDASAMYRGGGLCWHFPCSPHCSKTIAIVRNRRESLEENDPFLLTQLDAAGRDVITILADGSYEDQEVSAVKAVVVRFAKP